MAQWFQEYAWFCVETATLGVRKSIDKSFGSYLLICPRIELAEAEV